MTETTPSLSRRLFLRSSLAAGAAVTVTATPIVVDSVAAENAELLTLEESLPGIEAACITANAERVAARARYDAMEPKLPECLIQNGRNSKHHNDTVLYWCSETQRDAEHHAINPGPNRPNRRIFDSHQLASRFTFLRKAPDKEELSGKDKDAVELRHLYNTAVRYERAINKARKRSGIDAALEEMSRAFFAAYHCADKAAELPARSWRGIAIKARAFEISRQWDHDGPRRDHLSRANHLAGSVLLPEILALANGGSAVAS